MISFIVPAHNEEDLIGATLASIHAAARAAGGPYEIVVCDDASTDNTARLAAQAGAIVVSVQHRQISATRNSGARAARGDMFFFVDADTQVNAQVISAAIGAMRSGAKGGGAAIRFDGAVPLYARIVLPMLMLGFRLTRNAAGCFIFCTREAFAATQGFDEGVYGGEEIIMSRALRSHGRFAFLPVPVVTSGRKLRTYSGAELLGSMIRIASKGRKGVERREGLDLWYGQRRPDVGRQDD